MTNLGRATDTVVGGLATVGRVHALLRLVFAHVICLPFGVLGWWLLVRRRHITASVPGRIDGTGPLACPTPPPEATQVVCPFTFTFDLPPPHGRQTRGDQAVSVRARITTTQPPPPGTTGPPTTTTTFGDWSPPSRRGGDQVTVWYDPADPPGTAGLHNDDWRIAGGIVLGIVAAVLGIVWLRWWLTRRFRAVAALEGGTTALGMVGGALFRR